MKTPPTCLLAAHGQEAEIAPGCGALLVAYRAHGRDILYAPEPWIEHFPEPLRFGNPMLFPLAGAVTSAAGANSYMHDGVAYRIASHGFARHLPWRVIEVTDSSLECLLTATKFTTIMFPWKFSLRAKWELTTAGLEMRVIVKNEGGPGPMPVHFGWHPYFLLTEPQDRYRLDPPNAKHVHLDATGETLAHVSKPGTALDATLHGTWVYQGSPPLRAELLHADRGLVAWVETLGDVLSTLAIWSPAVDAPFVCLEPWTGPPNALNNPDLLPHLNEGETLEVGMRMGGS